MKIKVLILEDDPITSLDLKEILFQNGFLVTGIAKSFDVAMELYHETYPDALLVDIKLRGEKDGIDFVKEIKKLENFNSAVVYLTANSDVQTKFRAFDSDPEVFLTKPFNETNVVVSLELALNKTSKLSKIKKEANPLFLKKNNRFFKILPSKILYIQAEGSYSKIVTQNDEYLVSGNLNVYALKLEDQFIRTHRSFLVNLTLVTSLDAMNVYLQGRQLPIGRKYKENVLSILKKFP